MSDQEFQVIIVVFGVLLTVIGFFSAYTLNGINGRLKEQQEQLDSHSERITQNAAAIQANSDQDKLIREFFKESTDDLKKSIITITRKQEESYNELLMAIKGLIKT